jgi:hypothetical protein
MGKYNLKSIKDKYEAYISAQEVNSTEIKIPISDLSPRRKKKKQVPGFGDLRIRSISV